MGRPHVIISGTGRAGTTFLVQLLTELGLETGSSDSKPRVYPDSDAGMERDIRHPAAPYIVKRPAFCDSLRAILRESEIVIDSAIIPVRDLYSAAESRRDVTRRNGNKEGLPGGVWKTADPEAQELVLAQQLYMLVHTLAEHDIPMIWLHFPRLVTDPEYLYKKVQSLFGLSDYPSFLKVFQRVSRPELVHDFRADASRNGGKSTAIAAGHPARKSFKDRIRKFFAGS